MKIFWIGDWRVVPDVNRIERGEETRHVEPRVMDLLVYLADYAGEVISKDRLIRAVWPESFVSDGVVTYSVTQLRQLFGDDARNPRFIETIPRRGYRLIAEVTFEEPKAKESHYELVERLGQGGMGEVFLARDTILHRRVALKFLQPEKETDELWLRRLMREARAAAALDHPFICKVFETGRLDGRDFIAMEYIEGEKLSRRIERGPLPIEAALRISLEIAEGLECAHEHGIIHRDIKPSNVILTGQGHVKITDFGIAKRFRKSEDEKEEGTLTDTAHESPGTPDYMSPEQIRGEPLDPRSDLFQFGMVLYEMLAGVHPFRTATKLETTAAILDQDPRPLPTFRADAPERLERLVGKMLEKEPGERPKSTPEVHRELEGILSNPDATVPRIRRQRRWLAGLGATAILAVSIGTVLLWSLWNSETLQMAPLKITPFTTDGGRKSAPRFSPDGQRIAYAWRGGFGGNNVDIYVKGLGIGSTPLRLTNDPNADYLPTWSPDGRYIAFLRLFDDGAGAIYIVPSMGGQERRLFDRQGPQLAGSGHPVGVVHWSPVDDSLILSEAETTDGPARVIRISKESLHREVITDPPKETIGDILPEFSPDGRRIAFFRVASKVEGKVDVWVKPLDGGPARRLTQLEFDHARFRPTWTSDGKSILFLRDVSSLPTSRTSQLLRVNVETREVSAVEGLAQDIGRMGAWGDRLVFTQWMGGPWDIQRVPIPFTPDSSSDKVVGSSYDDLDVDVSPDGSRLVFSSGRSGSMNIWLSDSDGSDPVQLTFFEEQTGTPRWSPDGKRIVFDSLHSGNWDLWLVDPDGDVPHQLTTDSSDERNATWSRDGRWVYFSSTRTGRQEIFRMPSRGGAAIQLTEKGGLYARESVSADYIYYSKASESGVWRLPSTGKGKEVQVLSEAGQWSWTIGERGIYFTRPEGPDFCIYVFETRTRKISELYRQQGSEIHMKLAVTPDEKWLLFSEQPSPRSELMLAENFR